jgi:hypothetical protein
VPNLEVSNPNRAHNPRPLKVGSRPARHHPVVVVRPNDRVHFRGPNPARTFALNPYSVVAHKRNGVFFIAEDDPSVWHQVGGT